MKKNGENQDGPYIYEKPLKTHDSKTNKTSTFAANVVSIGAVLVASQMLLPAQAETIPESSQTPDSTPAPIAEENASEAVAESSSKSSATTSTNQVSIKQVVAAPKLGKLGTIQLPAEWSNTSAPTSAASAGQTVAGSTSSNTSSATGSSSGSSSSSSGSTSSSSGNTSSATGASSGSGSDDDDEYESREHHDDREDHEDDD